MRNRIITITALVILLVIGLFYRSSRSKKTSQPVEALPSIQETENQIKEKTGLQIPQVEGADKAELKDVRNEGALGLATRKVESGKLVVTILANLPDLETGKFYQGWLSNDNDLLSAGKLEEKKGGWFLQFSTTEDKKALGKVMVTLETKNDLQPEEKILEGQF